MASVIIQSLLIRVFLYILIPSYIYLFCFYFRTNTTQLRPTRRKGLIFWRNMDILLIRGAKLSRNMLLNSGKSKIYTYILCILYHSRLFVRLGQKTTPIYWKPSFLTAILHYGLKSQSIYVKTQLSKNERNI